MAAEPTTEARAARFAELARLYAGHGMALIRLDGKMPRERSWPSAEPDLDPDHVAGLWHTWGKKWNVGCVLGPSQLVVVEPDTDEARERLLELLGGRLPPVPIVRSGGKSLHLYFRADNGVQPAARDGLELRCGRQQVVLPPSIHPDTGREYTWLERHELGRDDVELLTVPDAVRAYFASAGERKRADPVGDEIHEKNPGRHYTLVSIAGSMRRRGLGAEEIATALLVVNKKRCRPPLDELEVVEIARDVARRYEPAPRDREQEKLRYQAERILDRYGGHAPQEEAEAEKRRRQMRRRPLSAVTPRRVEFVIPSKVPAGTHTLVAGVGGLGKSALALSWAATITLAGADVLVISYEDDAEQVLRPRFEAAGGDLERLHELSVEAKDGMIILPLDLDELARHVRETHARMLIIDPVSASIDLKLDAHRDQDVRVVLGHLAELAERERLACLQIAHLNKAPGSDPYLRINGSTAFYNAARSVLTVTRDSEGDSLRLVAHHKSNWGALSDVERWRIRPAALAGGIETAVMEFVEVAEGVSRDDVLSSPAAGVEKRADAETLIVAELALGPKSSAEVKASGARRGISPATIKRAAKDLEVEVEQRSTPTGRTTYWALPEGVGSVLDTHGAPTPSGRIVEPNLGGSAHERELRPDPTPLTASCGLHPGAHEVKKRAAGLVYLACGCKYSDADAAEGQQEGEQP